MTKTSNANAHTIKGILFDKDGTLLDFNGSWLAPYVQVTQFIAQSMGRPELKESLMTDGGFIPETGGWVSDSLLTSASNQQILEFWSQQIGQPIVGENLHHIKQIFSRAASRYAPAIEDLHGFLNRLKARGMRLGLATMDDEKNARRMLATLQLTGLFDFVCGADSGYGVKPEPGMVHAFCQSCGLAAKQVIMVGDSPKDLNMGKNAGAAYSIGVLTGAHDRAALSAHADDVLDDISCLNRFLRGLNSAP
ncbi:HAD family hydrolase [Candidatus Spongiihabitans sp.]|uniref:HAD family hydrolase n=1 Tax=Candidatus Spongiihabitans sp. TaxID=3101308 RepID=UPI003C7AB654